MNDTRSDWRPLFEHVKFGRLWRFSVHDRRSANWHRGAFVKLPEEPEWLRPRIARNSREGLRLSYRRRSAVEHEFGRLNDHYPLAILRVRGIERIRLQANPTTLARLAPALARARTLAAAA